MTATLILEIHEKDGNVSISRNTKMDKGTLVERVLLNQADNLIFHFFALLQKPPEEDVPTEKKNE